MKLTNKTKYVIKHEHIDKIASMNRCYEYMLKTNGVYINNYKYIENQYIDILFNKYNIDNYEIFSGYQILKMASQFNLNEYKRKARCYARVDQLLNAGKCIFITFTFSNDYYKSTSQETRRKYVYRCLKEMNVPFIANQDFGKLNGRHHIHALILADNINLKLWKYGNLDAERVWQNNEKVGEYISKLTEHTLKETTKNNRIMYSRNYEWIQKY